MRRVNLFPVPLGKEEIKTVDALIKERDGMMKLLDELPAQIRDIQRRIEDLVRPIRALNLTVRQAEVLKLVRLDLSNKEIAVKLNVSTRTIKFHVSRILVKCGKQQFAGSRRQL